MTRFTHTLNAASAHSVRSWFAQRGRPAKVAGLDYWFHARMSEEQRAYARWLMATNGAEPTL